MARRHRTVQKSTREVLSCLLSHGGPGLFPAEVAATTGVALNIVSPILKRLSDDGVLEASIDPGTTYLCRDGRRPRTRYRIEPEYGHAIARKLLERSTGETLAPVRFGVA